MSFTTSKEAREAGWFSRRHQSRDVHDAAVASRNESHGRRARRRAAEERAAVFASLSPSERRVRMKANKEEYDRAH